MTPSFPFCNKASDTYESGDEQAAEELIRKAHWEGYKNSLLETVVRRYVSQSQDIAFNAEFTRIMELVKDGKPARMVRASAAVLHDDIADVLPGLLSSRVARWWKTQLLCPSR